MSAAPAVHEHMVACDKTATRYFLLELKQAEGVAALLWPSKPMCLPTTPAMAFVMHAKFLPTNPAWEVNYGMHRHVQSATPLREFVVHLH